MSDLTMHIILIVISRFMQAFIIFNFMERIFSRVYRHKALYNILFITAVLILSTSSLFDILLVNLVIATSVILAVGVGLYGAKKSSDILILFLFYMFLGLTEVIGQTVMSFIFSRPFNNQSGNIMQSLITFFCYQIAMFFIVKNKKEFNKAGNWITLVVIPVISLFLLYSIMRQLLTDQSSSTYILYTAISCILVFVINIVVYTLFNRIAVLNYQNEQYMLLEHQKQLQYRYFHDLERSYEDSRKLFHDINNHLNTIEQLYQHEHSSASEYTEALRNKIDALSFYPPSSNRILNILINGWLAKAKSSDIDFRYNCEDVDLNFIADIDLNTILTNLLDNAFDECISNQLDDNIIDLSICQINNFIVLNISNSCETPPQKNGQRYISQKEKHMGLGLSNVKNTVEQYKGSMSILFENCIFAVQITFSGRESGLPQ